MFLNINWLSYTNITLKLSLHTGAMLADVVRYYVMVSEGTCDRFEFDTQQR